MPTHGPCPRCAGQLYTETDIYGTWICCLQCGYLTPIDGYDPEGKRQSPKVNKIGARHPLRGRTAKQRHR